MKTNKRPLIIGLTALLSTCVTNLAQAELNWHREGSPCHFAKKGSDPRNRY